MIMRTFNKPLAAALALSLLLLSTGCRRNEKLTVVFPKIGSADAALLITEEATVLIDTGESDDGGEILELLQAYDRDTIDLLLISHYDKDHVGGAAEILERCTVKRVIGSTSPRDSEETDAYYAALAETGLTEETPSAPLVLSLGGMNLTVLPPEQTQYEKDQSNNSSLVVSVSFQDTRLLFTGDAMAERVAEFAPQLDNGAYDLIKIPHHGRDTDTASQLLPAMKPGAASIITSSKKEPEDEALAPLLTDAGLNPYLTRNGDIVVTSDGFALNVLQD